MLRNVFLWPFVIKTKGGIKLYMGQLTIFQREGLLELDGFLLHIGDRIEFLLFGAWIPGIISHDARGWYIALRENTGIRVQTGLSARLLSLSSNALPLPVRLVNYGE